MTSIQLGACLNSGCLVSDGRAPDLETKTAWHRQGNRSGGSPAAAGGRARGM